MAAIARWPDVPHVYGWLTLDRRGQWRLQDSPINNTHIIEFINRNYECDDRGAWFFQNGPQRVYVELACTPWVWRLQPDGTVLSHTGREAQVESAWLDETGHLYLLTDLGLGLVHTQDMGLAAEAVEAGRWTPQDCIAAKLPAIHHFQRRPHP